MITVGAKPTRRPGTTRFARILGLDGNPLRRVSDRAEAWIRIGVIAAFLVAGPLTAIGAGHWTYHAGMTEARTQAAQRHSAQGVLLQSTPPAAALAPASREDQVWVRARWEGTSAIPRTGEVLAPMGSPAGSVVTVWLDASGKVTSPPLQGGQITGWAITVAALTPAALALALLAVLRLARRLLDKRRLAAWDAAWSTVGPEWTRRRP
jgi:hypothetical protein